MLLYTGIIVLGGTLDGVDIILDHTFIDFNFFGFTEFPSLKFSSMGYLSSQFPCFRFLVWVSSSFERGFAIDDGSSFLFSVLEEPFFYVIQISLFLYFSHSLLFWYHKNLRYVWWFSPFFRWFFWKSYLWLTFDPLSG